MASSVKYIYHALIVNKGVKAYSNLSVLCDMLKVKESPTKLSNLMRIHGNTISCWSNLAKTSVIITKLMIESRSSIKSREYIKLERHYDIDYLTPDDDKDIEITQKSLREI